MPLPIIPKSEYQTVLNKYFIENQSPEELANFYSVSRTNIYNIFKRMGKTLDDNKKRKQFKINYNFFELIDTEEKAYILGFLWADGYLTEKYYRISISLAEQDKKILEKILLLMGSNHNLHYSKGQKIYWKNKAGIEQISKCQPTWGFCINSKKMYEDLLNKGLFANKTLTIKLPNFSQVPEHLYKHFLRGLFDGDGSIGKIERNAMVNLCGNFFVLEGVLNYFAKLDINFKLYPKNEKYGSIIAIGIINTQKFLDYIYKNVGIYLDRKYNLYLKYIERYQSRLNLIKYRGIVFRKDRGKWSLRGSKQNGQTTKYYGDFCTKEEAYQEKLKLNLQYVKY